MSNPITPERFQAALKDLELEQLHEESARLQNSIFHLRRSNIALEEFPDDKDCQEAIVENRVTIDHQLERIRMVKEEVERRGFAMPCGEGEGEGEGGKGETNGVAGGEGAAVNGAPAANGTTGATAGLRGDGEPRDEEEEGVYL